MSVWGNIYTLLLFFLSAIMPFRASIKNKGNNLILSKIINRKQKDNTGKEIYKLQEHHVRAPHFVSK